MPRSAHPSRSEPAGPLIRVRRSKINGSGVFALCAIPRGTRVIEYVGERVSHAEADRRYEGRPANNGHTFLFIVDDRTPDGDDALGLVLHQSAGHLPANRRDLALEVAHAGLRGVLGDDPGDRLEIIRIPGYTLEEKRVIARKHLLPKQIAEHGLERDQMQLDDEALDDMIAHYTREAGVRNLEREIAAVCRHAAVEVAGGSGTSVHVTKDVIGEILGPPHFLSEVASRKAEVGVCAGLAWTPTGGEILFVEARAMPGKGALKLTGQVGDVMSESANTAFSWVRANATTLGIDSSHLQIADIHLHLPAGAVRKDGPSAGVAIVTALMSLFTHKPVRSDVAITGEVTLRGLVLPVGGIKEKVLAAHRGGIRTVLLPERNRKDIEDIPEEVRRDLDIRFVKRVDEVLEVALADFKPGERGLMPFVELLATKPGSDVAGERLPS